MCRGSNCLAHLTPSPLRVAPFRAPDDALRLRPQSFDYAQDARGSAQDAPSGEGEQSPMYFSPLLNGNVHPERSVAKSKDRVSV